MAIRSPLQVQVTTESTGSGPYTLTNVVPKATGYRSIANAVADGSLSNGDTVHYQIFQNNAPTGKMIERGWGTINTSTLVFTPTDVKERSASLVSGGGWGAGTKDFLIIVPGAESITLLDQPNRFTQNQTIAKLNPAILFETGGVTRASINQANLDLWLQYFNASGQLRGQLLVGESSVWQYLNAAGAIKGQLTIGDNSITFSDGTTTVALARETTGGNIVREISGLKVVRFAGGGVTKISFNSAPPTGFTRINVPGERIPKFAQSGESPEAQGGSWTISGLTLNGTTDNHVLTVGEIPSHDHQFFNSPGGTSGSHYPSYSTYNAGSLATTTPTGGGGGHSHTLASATVVSAGTWRPAYEIFVKASCD